jgi:hypothetical protein
VAEQIADLGLIEAVELVELADVVDQRARDDDVGVDVGVAAALEEFGEREPAGGHLADVVDEPLLAEGEPLLVRRSPGHLREVVDAVLLHGEYPRLGGSFPEPRVRYLLQFGERRLDVVVA